MQYMVHLLLGKSCEDDVEMASAGEDEGTVGYSPRAALVSAIRDWLPQFYKVKGGHSQKHSNISITTTTAQGTDIVADQHDNEKDSSDTEAVSRMDASPAKDDTDAVDSEMKDLSEQDDAKNLRNSPDSSLSSASVGDMAKSSTKNKLQKKRIEDMEPLSVSDLLLLCDLFYLPFEHGPRSVHLLKQAHWLVSSADKIKDAQDIPQSKHTPEVREWYERAIRFHGCHKDMGLLVDKFVNIPNRDLLYELYPYVCDMRSVLGLLNSYIKWHGRCLATRLSGKLDSLRRDT